MLPSPERRSSLRRVRHHDHRVSLSSGHLRMSGETVTGVGGCLLLRLNVWLRGQILGHLRLDLRLRWRCGSSPGAELARLHMSAID